MEKRGVVSPEITPDTENVAANKSAAEQKCAPEVAEIESLDADFRKRAAAAAANKIQ
jgi:hypothetical protein